MHISHLPQAKIQKISFLKSMTGDAYPGDAASPSTSPASPISWICDTAGR